jgi:hypothetical protein
MIILHYLWLLIALGLTLWGVVSVEMYIARQLRARAARRHRARATATAAMLRGEVNHLLGVPFRHGEYSDGG